MPPPDEQLPNGALALGEGGFEPYLRAVRRHPVLFVAIVLAAVLGAGVWVTVRPVKYKATAEVLVTPVPSTADYSGLPILQFTPGDAIRPYQSAVAMLNSDTAAQQTARQLGSGWSTGRVSGAIAMQQFGESDIVAIQSTADSAGLAIRLANSFAMNSLLYREQILARAATALLRAAHFTSPTQPAILRNLASGVDPEFSLANVARSATGSAGHSAWRLLVLSLIPGVVLATAAALLVDAVAERRRRRPSGAGGGEQPQSGTVAS